MGYDSFPEFAYDFYFSRDYTPEQAEAYLTRVGQVLYDPYVALSNSDAWDHGYVGCDEIETFHFVKDVASVMGGTPAEAFEVLETNHLYDIAYGENKFNSSFETYLWTYHQPFVFMNPQLGQMDKLTFGHEFGHFCGDYICGGSYVGTDVAEVQSQTFEYLSLVYGENTAGLTRYKMADSLCTYVEQSAYALFEHQVYDLTGDELTVENIQALYARIGEAFGFTSWDWDSRDFVVTPHFFTQPMYVVSYVVSNDVAMQIYQLELEKPGAGLELYEQCLLSQESYIIYFAEECGPQSPFAENRLEEVAKLFEGK
jgi:oligoendopeptidase F